MLKKIKDSSAEDYEKIRDIAASLFESIRDAFYEFSHLLTMEQLSRTKKELTELGNQTINEAQDLLKQHPLGVAAGALSLGFIVGTLFARSK